MKQITLIAIYFSVITQLSAQTTKIDSLLGVLNISHEDTGTVNLLNVICWEMLNEGDSRAENYIDRAQQLAEKLKYKKGLAVAIHSKGVLLCNQSNYNQALATHKIALSIRQEIADKEGIASSYNVIGLTNSVIGNYAEAFRVLKAALKINKEIGNQRGIYSNTVNIGLVNNKLGNYPEAMKYYIEALKISERMGDENAMARCYNNIGYIHTLEKQYDEALKDFEAGLKLYEKFNNRSGISYIYDNLGSIFQKKGDAEEALKCFNYSLKLKKELSDKREIAGSFRYIGEVYYLEKNYTDAIENYQEALAEFNSEQAKSDIAATLILLGQANTSINKFDQSQSYLDSALHLAKLMGEKQSLKDTYFELARLDSARSNSVALPIEKRLEYARNALINYKHYIVYNDSLLNEENSRKIVREALQYEFEKKEAITQSEHDKEQALAKAEIQRQTLIKNSVIGGVAIAGFFTFLLVHAANRKRKSNFEKQVAQVETKALRSQMNPHFIFNSLNSIDDYILNHDIANSSLYVNKFSRLMRLILESSRKEEVSLKEDLESLELYMQLENLRMQNKVKCSIDVAPGIDTDNTMIPPMLLQPFVENAFKHAFDGIENPQIEIKISLNDEVLQCTVTDNGKGRSTEQKIVTETHEKHQSLGMTVTRERLDIISKIKKSKAYFTFEDLIDSHKKATGTKVLLTVPASFGF